MSLLFAATPWLFPSGVGLAVGLLAHIVWFTACEWVAPPRQADRRNAPSPPKPIPLPPAVAPATGGFVPVPVLAAFDESDEIKTIRMARPDGFEFVAGQFIAVRVPIDGKDRVRCYSLSSAPGVRGYLEISVRRQGLVSGALHATAHAGAQLSIRSPNGAFRYPSGDDRPIVLLAGGVGITPLVSMLRHAVATEPSRRVTLLYSARTPADFAFRDELSMLARRHPQVRVHLASTRAASPDIYPGRIDADLIRTTVADLRHSICFVCGPKPMIEQMRLLLAEFGVPEPQIRFESFEAAVAASAAREASPGGAVERNMRTDTRPAVHGHQVTCTHSRRTIVISAGQTLLEAVETAGLPIESMCRAGICSTCRTRVTDGSVECTSDALSAAEREQGFVLACVATAHSDCTIDL
jgi:ferredoxin-NADP reductase